MIRTHFILVYCILLLRSCNAQPSYITQPLPRYIPFPYTSDKKVEKDTGMVVTAHPLASHVGVEVLRRGGNAVDAMVAVHFALAVVYPQAGNIGGGGFMVWRGAKGDVATLDFREKAPAGANETMFQDSVGNVLVAKSHMGIFSCGVPGSVEWYVGGTSKVWPITLA